MGYATLFDARLKQCGAAAAEAVREFEPVIRLHTLDGKPEGLKHMLQKQHGGMRAGLLKSFQVSEP